MSFGTICFGQLSHNYDMTMTFQERWLKVSKVVTVMHVVTQWPCEPNIASSHWHHHNTDSHITTPSTPSLALSNWVWWDFVTYANPPQLHHPQTYARLPHSLTVIITPLGMQAQVASWRCHSDKSPPLWPSHTQMWSKHGIWMKKKVSHDVHPIVCLLQCQ